MEFTRRIRPINLLIIFLTQSFFYFAILKESFYKGEGLYNVWIFALISVLTMLIAASGYIINDVMDIHIDQINHPNKIPLDKSLWIRHYVKIVLAGFLLNLVLCYYTELWIYIGVYPLACFLLFLYSSHLKCKGLIGNLVVALFSAFVVGILLIPIIPALHALPIDRFENILNPFIYYFLLGFLISLIREIIKDMEDVEGDRLMNCQTVPVALGLDRAKIYVIFFSITLIWALAMWLFQLRYSYQLWHFIYLGITVFGYLMVVIFWVLKAKEKSDYTKISRALKNIMILGIVFLLLSKM